MLIVENAALSGTPAVRAAIFNGNARHAHCEAMLNLQVRLLRDHRPATNVEGG